MVQLGVEQVPVELGEKALEVSVDQALEVFARYKPLTRIESYITTGTGMGYHPMPEDVTGIRLVELSLGINQSIIAGMNIESQMLAGYPVFIGIGDSAWDIQYLDLRRRWIKAVSRELNSDPDWAAVLDPETNIWKLYTFATSLLYVKVDVTINHKEDLTSIPTYWRKWFRDYALSEAKLILAQARGKFDSIPVAGGRMSMNGPTLIAQAEAKQAELINIMERSRADMFPQWA
jgi:hypothetical protein